MTADLLNIESLYSEQERLFAERVRYFATTAALPLVQECYEAGRFPTDLIPELGGLGLLGMLVPDDQHQVLSSPVTYGLAALELEAVDSALRSFVSVQGSLVMHAIATYGSPDQRAEWLPGLRVGELIGCFGLSEPEAGSDAGAMRTHAKRSGDDWVLNGSKMWITNGSIADVAVVWAATDEGIRGFLVPRRTKGFSASDIRHKLSMRASVTSELAFDNCRLPASAMLERAEGLRAPLDCVNEARFGIIFGVLGAARTCIEIALSYSDSRQAFGHPLASFQLTQAKLAEMSTAYSTATLLALHIGRMKEGGTLRPEQVSVGKLNNVRTALEIARQARTILGANGITMEYQVLRHAANLEMVRTYEGTDEVHLLTIGRALTGISAFS